MKATIRQASLALFLLSTSVATAQEHWSMDDCMRYAADHAMEVKRQHIEAADARSARRSALLEFAPRVGAGVSGQYSWGRNVDPETNTYNTVTTFNNYYQLYAELSVFDGGQTLNAFRLARERLAHSQTAVQQARDEQAITAMQHYADAAYAEACTALLAEKLEESRRLLTQTRRQEELGLKSLPDVAQAEAQVAEDEYNLLHQQNLLQTSLLALKSAMNYAADDTLKLGTMEESKPTPMAADAPLLAATLPAVLTANHNTKNARYNYLITRGRLYPSLSLSAAVATNYYKNLSSGGAAPAFHRQWRDNMGEYVYATLSVPLFNASTHRSVSRARAEWRLAELERDETLRRLADEARQAMLDSQGFAREVAQMERKVDADSLAWRLSRRKYDEGLLSALDLRTAANTLLQARVSLLQARLMLVLKQRLVAYYRSGKLFY